VSTATANLAFRLYWDGRESHEGTKLVDTPENRAKAEARSRVIDQEMQDGVFDYLRWFPDGNLARRLSPTREPSPSRSITASGFFRRWGSTGDDAASAPSATEKQSRPVSKKWAINRASAIKAHVLDVLGNKHLDQLTSADLTRLQRVLLKKGLKAATVDGVVHSAFRGMLRDARAAGYAVTDLHRLYDRGEIQRLDRGSEAREIDAFTEAERDAILEGFRKKRPHYYPFVFHQFWTGARPSEAIALRWEQVDIPGRFASGAAACSVRTAVRRLAGVSGRW